MATAVDQTIHANCSRATMATVVVRHGNCSFSDMTTVVKLTWKRVQTMATAGTLVTVTRGVQDHKAGGLTYGRVGVIYFSHT